MTVKRYVLIGGWIYRPNGRHEYVSAQRLADLYRVDRDECVFADIDNPRSLLGLPKLLRLYPDITGYYDVPEFS